MNNQKEKSENDEYVGQLRESQLEKLIYRTVHVVLNERGSNSSDSEKDPKEELVPRLDLAQEFEVSAITIDRWVKKGLLPSPIKQGGRVYFKRSKLQDHLNRKGGEDGQV